MSARRLTALGVGLDGAASGPKPRAAFVGALAIALGTSGAARAGTFDAAGDYRLADDAIATIDFTKAPERYIPADADASCQDPMFTAVMGDDAIEGGSYITLKVNSNCAERFLFPLPKKQASYRASVWMRHGALAANVFLGYADGSGLDDLSVQLTPTGRTTSDGWVELASNAFPADGTKLARAYLKVVDYASRAGVDVDAFEVREEGEFVAQKDCAGLGDPVCGAEQVCVYNRCVFGPAAVPVLPADVVKNDVVDVLESQVRLFFGGKLSRAEYLPDAIARFEKMREAKTAWEFWSLWAAGIHALHDWHTDTNMGIAGTVRAKHRLNVCFFEGDADRSHDTWPTEAGHADILVSHVGGDGTAGLHPGDRLLAVDGMPPLVWAASLAGSDWGFHIATDPAIEADLAEALGGPWWGGGLVIRYAHDITVLRCGANGDCNGIPETIAIADLPNDGSSPDVACDNRPLYHFDAANNPDPTKHYVFDTFFRGAIAGTDPSEKIYGMVWDTLWGANDPNSSVNAQISQAILDWKANARGVILDHRAGNGGTLDAATNLTRLVRPPGVVAVTRMPMEIAGFDGPKDAAEGLAIFDDAKALTPYNVGADDWAQDLPVALILHRDGSASDYMPYGMKGAPRVRLFGPHPTAGAFSTYIELRGWGPLYWQIASGDTIGADGSSLIGHGVVPDVVVLPKQSDLIAGKDTLFEAALAWVRQELTP
jgi:hypothetical protein